jgi:hypothetical protein
MAKIYITFSTRDGCDPHEFDWNVRTSPLAEKWLTEMVKALKCPYRMREERFCGWANTKEDLQYFADRINEAVVTINSFYGDRYRIAERAQLGMEQKILNQLHHHFELLLGQSWNPSELSRNAPMEVHSAIRRLNDRIHDYEHALKAQTLPGTPKSFQCQFLPYPQRPLSLDDLATFSYACDPGDIVTNYCQLGKTWVEAFGDQDEEIFLDNISPLRFYAPAFMCNFFEATPASAASLREQVKEFIREKSRSFGVPIDPDDVRQALGHSVYASLPSHSPLLRCSLEERDTFIREHSTISAMRIRSGAEEVARTFPEADSYYPGDHTVPESVWLDL